MMKLKEKVYGLCGAVDVEVYRTFSQRRPFIVKSNNIILAHTDTEEKARMYAEAYNEGYAQRGLDDYNKKA
jgi:hypothetical protein